MTHETLRLTRRLTVSTLASRVASRRVASPALIERFAQAIVASRRCVFCVGVYAVRGPLL
jgi:hypothetical protein